MKTRFLTPFCVFATLAASLVAQPRPADGEPRPGDRRPSPERFVADKVNFIVRDMKLSTADSARFVPIYKKLQEEKFNLMIQSTGAVHRLRREMKEHPDRAIPDSLYIAAVESEYRYNIEDAKLESRYVEEFKAILSPRQLYEYSRAEKRFKRNFMNEGNRRRGSSDREGERPDRR